MSSPKSWTSTSKSVALCLPSSLNSVYPFVTWANPTPKLSAIEFPITQSPQDVSERQREVAICRSINELSEVQTSALQGHIGALNKQDMGVGIIWHMCDGVYYSNTDIAEFTVVLGMEKWK